MSVTIQIKRGTEAEIQSATLASGELAFATDSKNVFCSDGSGKHLVGSLLIDSLANRPASGVAGRLFLDSGSGILYVDTVTAWANHSHTESDISDLGSYSVTGHTHPESDISDLGSYASTTHASGHLSGASDEIDADKIDIDFSPSNYTAETVENVTDSTAQLTSHLQGIDTALGASSGITTGKAIAMAMVFS